MPRIPILPDVRFRDALPEHHKVVTRLRGRLLALREPPPGEGPDSAGGADRRNDDWETTGPVGFRGDPPEEGSRKLDAGPVHGWSSRAPLLTDGDEARIARRARRHVDRITAATGLAHLDWEQRDRLAVLRDGAAVVGLPTEHRADEITAALHAEMPWMAPATEAV